MDSLSTKMFQWVEMAIELIRAVLDNDFLKLKRLLESGTDVNIFTAFGYTALTHAAGRGLTEMVRILLDVGADANICCYKGYTALIYAARGGHTEIARMLLSARADVNAESEDNWTALARAAWYGHLETVNALIHAGADTSIKSTGWTTSELALLRGHFEIADILQSEEAWQKRRSLLILRKALRKGQPGFTVMGDLE